MAFAIHISQWKHLQFVFALVLKILRFWPCFILQKNGHGNAAGLKLQTTTKKKNPKNRHPFSAVYTVTGKDDQQCHYFVNLTCHFHI